MRRRHIPALALAAFAALPASAHDFWIQPLSFWIAPNSAVVTSLQVGHGEARERWNSDAKRVVEFRSLGPGGAWTDRQRELRAGSMDQDHALTFAAPGTHVVVLQTSHAQSTLPAIRFQDYLKQEGLTPALELRARTRTQAKPGREIYSRRAKALVQVGPPSAAVQAWVTRPVGHSLEIVPDSNPYAPGAPGGLAVHVYFHGRPLPAATVMLNNLQLDGRPVAIARTDAAGRAAFTFPRAGAWQLNVIWTQPLKGDPRADWDTTFASLTFGFPPGQL